jgi:hypothetical protein
MLKIISILSVLCAVSLVPISCNRLSQTSAKSNMRDSMSTMQKHRVKLNLNRMAYCIPDNDTARTDTTSAPYRLLTYIDSTNCTPCLLNEMHKWNDIIDNTRTNGNRVNYIFIFEPKSDQIEDAHFAVESSGLKNRVYLDTASVFRKENKFIPKDSKYHTMLIDKNDSIILIGNPKNNKKVEEIFLDIIN